MAHEGGTASPQLQGVLEEGGVSARFRPYPRLHRLVATSVIGALAAVACGNLSPSGDQDPCTQLGLVCDACKQPMDQQNCQAALAAADDAQCAAVLDQTSFQEDCDPKEGGADAAEAAALPACGVVGTPDAGCACSGGVAEAGVESGVEAGLEAGAASCSPGCAGGGCEFTCVSGTCAPTCAGGHCSLHCESGAVCEASCAGGHCVFDCKAGSHCENACPGGGCSFQCEPGSICNDSCGSVATCNGM
jgi:hypothetical protein